MRGKLYFIIRQLILSLICLVYFLPAQSVSAVSDSGAGWSVPFQKCWEFETSQMTAFPPQSDYQQTIFQTLADGTLTAIDAAGGKILWRSQFGGEIISNTLFEDNKLYLVNRITDEDEPQLIARSVSAATGLTLWQKNLSLNDSSRIFVSANGGNSISLVSETGQILFADKTSGAEVFRKELQSTVTAAPVIFENKVFIGTSENKITAFPATGGESVFDLNLPNAPTGNFFVSASAIVAGDRSGGVRAVRLADRKLLWKARTGAQIVDITEVSGNFLISSNDGFVYLLAARNGDRIWKKRLPGRLIGKPLIYNNFVLLQTIDGAAALILDLDSGKPVNQIPFGENVFSANSALLVHQRVIIPTSRGLLAFGAECSEK